MVLFVGVIRVVRVVGVVGVVSVVSVVSAVGVQRFTRRILEHVKDTCQTQKAAGHLSTTKSRQTWVALSSMACLRKTHKHCS